MSTNQDEWTDHDPEAPMSAETEASLLAAIRNTPASHPDAPSLAEFVRRKSQPLDLKPAKDA